MSYVEIHPDDTWVLWQGGKITASGQGASKRTFPGLHVIRY